MIETIKNAGVFVKNVVSNADLKKVGQGLAGIAGIAGAALLTVAGAKAISDNDKTYTVIKDAETAEENTAEVVSDEVVEETESE